MSIEITCAHLKTILDDFTIVFETETLTVHGFDPPPAKIDTADLIATYTLTGPANYDTEIHGDRLLDEARQFRQRFAIAFEGQSTPDWRERLLRVALPALRDRLASYPKLAGAKVRMRPQRDSGVIPLPEYQGAYGFEITLLVNETVRRTYAPGE